MAGYPVDIRRCQHIKTNGTQCGSPALRNEAFCFNHRESRPEKVEVCGEGGQGSTSVLVPVFEDASSIQMVVRQVAMLVLQGKIDNKRAGLVLYALQIASSNLKQMEAEKPRPVQVVVDTEKVGETPLGMTPWSGNGKGHEIEEPADIAADRALRERNGWWARDYQRKKEWIEERLHEIDHVLAKHPAPKEDELFSELASVSTSLELVTKSMNERLEQGRM